MFNNSEFFMKRIMVYALFVVFATVGSCFGSGQSDLIKISFNRRGKEITINHRGIRINFAFDSYDAFKGSLDSNYNSSSLYHNYEEEFAKIFFTLFKQQANNLAVFYKDDKPPEGGLIGYLGLGLGEPAYTRHKGEFWGTIHENFKIDAVEGSRSFYLAETPLFKEIFKTILLLLLPHETLAAKIRNNIKHPLELYAYLHNTNEKNNQIITLSTTRGVISDSDIKNYNLLLFRMHEFKGPGEKLSFYTSKINDTREINDTSVVYVSPPIFFNKSRSYMTEKEQFVLNTIEEVVAGGSLGEGIVEEQLFEESDIVVSFEYNRRTKVLTISEDSGQRATAQDLEMSGFDLVTNEPFIKLNLSGVIAFKESVMSILRSQQGERWKENVITSHREDDISFFKIFYNLFKKSILSLLPLDNNDDIALKKLPISNGFAPEGEEAFDSLWQTILLFLSFNDRYADKVAKNIEVYGYDKNKNKVVFLTTINTGEIRLKKDVKKSVLIFIRKEQQLKVPKNRSFHEEDNFFFALPIHTSTEENSLTDTEENSLPFVDKIKGVFWPQEGELREEFFQEAEPLSEIREPLEEVVVQEVEPLVEIQERTSLWQTMSPYIMNRYVLGLGATAITLGLGAAILKYYNSHSKLNIGSWIERAKEKLPSFKNPTSDVDLAK